ncbi:hypothetical protein [Mesorhizobium sp. M8A.F.Ca.ET.021.01.1.1]|uniref:hypothetical protein n=1 Tax=Mesorhizobium sp. M8A.F.Ca.ET.021.01.1.1 TaxID=2496757 RepID=UPI000FCB34FC|nr:hypothetical protein [Mesorhizobium sp. M8A.F.Ca.ET.021.01.1.1]RUW57116.1 hypothetical protein EOA36_00605 [Mesorhizobium sp. M8A.F.Ca.ET.021.01.1.1]
MMTHEQMMALRARGVRIDNIFIPGLASIGGNYDNAFGDFIVNVDPDDQIVSDLAIGVDADTDDATIVAQIEHSAVAGKLPGWIVMISFEHGGEQMTSEVYVTTNIFEEVVDFLESVAVVHTTGQAFFAETVQ